MIDYYGPTTEANAMPKDGQCAGTVQSGIVESGGSNFFRSVFTSIGSQEKGLKERKKEKKKKKSLD